MKLDLPIIGEIGIPKWAEIPVLFLAPVWAPFLAAFYLLRIVLWPVLSVVLLLVLPLACMALLGALLGLPGPLIVTALFDNPPIWLLVISVMPGGLGMYWGLKLAGRIADTRFFQENMPFQRF